MRPFVLTALFVAISACTMIGSHVITPTTDSVVVRASGGEPPSNPQHLDCPDHTALYAFDRKTHELSWDFCFVQEHGKRSLSVDEAGAVEQTLADLELVRAEGVCPPDAVDVRVTTSAGTYRNDSCGQKSPVLDGHGLQKLLKLLSKLASP